MVADVFTKALDERDFNHFLKLLGMLNPDQSLLKKYNMEHGSPAKVPMPFAHKITADLSGEAVDQKQYRGMIGSLLYLTASRPDLMFATCLCARYQANPKASHLTTVKQIFRYLRRT